MSVAKRGDGRFVVKFKDEEGRWKQRSFRTDEEARQFDADCQYNKMENTRLTLLEAVLVYLKNTEYAEKTIATYEFLVCGHDRQNGYHREGPAEFIADRFVDTLTRRDLENVRERCRNDGLTMTSINSYVSKLKAAINFGASNRICSTRILGGNIGNSQAQKTSHGRERWKTFTNSFLCSRRGFNGQPKPPLPYVCVPAYPNFSVSNGRHSTGRLEPCAFTCRKFVLQNLYSRQRHILPKRGYGSSQTWQLEKTSFAVGEKARQ